MPINYFSNLISSCGTCSVDDLPSLSVDACACDTWTGRLNDLYFVDCSSGISEANLLDTAWWSANLEAGKIKNIGVGIGGYQKEEVTTFDAGGCGDPTVEQVKWALNYQVFCIDKSSSFTTHSFADALINGAMAKYNLVARYCDAGAEDVIVPIGKVDLADFDNILPTATNEFMSFTFKFTWKALYSPRPLIVSGLNAVLPKATRG